MAMKRRGGMCGAGAAARSLALIGAAGGVAHADEPARPLETTPAEAPTVTATAVHDPLAEKLGVFAGVGYLASPGASGTAFTSGLRVRVAKHVAASLDLGYGLLEAAPSVQDRWWVIPSAAFVLTAGAARFDVGAGAGVGTSSGYASWASYKAAPFTPGWHATVPAVRAHVTVTLPLTVSVDVFARADVASLVLAGSGSSHTDSTDSAWLTLSLGFQHRLL